jgi:hypothetical protein
MWWAL